MGQCLIDADMDASGSDLHSILNARQVLGTFEFFTRLKVNERHGVRRCLLFGDFCFMRSPD